MTNIFIKITSVYLFCLIIIISLINTNYDTADMRVYSSLFKFAAKPNHDLLFFKYDPLFFIFMRLFSLFSSSFFVFHITYISIFSFLWIYAFSRSSMVFTLRRVICLCSFLFFLFSSSYINESFRIFPVILFAGFILNSAHNLYRTTRLKVLAVSPYLCLVLIHWSAFFILLARNALNYKNMSLTTVLTFLVFLFLAGFFLQTKLTDIYMGYQYVQESLAGSELPFVNPAVYKILFILLLLPLSGNWFLFFRRIFISALLICVVFFVSKITYTAVARLCDLYFFASLLYLMLQSPHNKTQRI